MLIGKTAASGKFGVIPDLDIRECDGEYDEHKCFVCSNEEKCRKEKEGDKK